MQHVKKTLDDNDGVYYRIRAEKNSLYFRKRKP